MNGIFANFRTLPVPIEIAKANCCNGRPGENGNLWGLIRYWFLQASRHGQVRTSGFGHDDLFNRTFGDLRYPNLLRYCHRFAGRSASSEVASL